MGNTRSVPIIEKQGIHDFQTTGGTFALSSMEGWRKTMEDTFIFFSENDYCAIAIFDGHGTDKCSIFCKNNFEIIFKKYLNDITPENISIALINTFKKMDIEYEKFVNTVQDSDKRRFKESGSTGLVAIITNSHYIIANLGDSRGIIIDKLNYAPQYATIDHKPNLDLEKSRIYKAGHFVSENRVDNILATSRAFGDFQFKNNAELNQENQAVTCVPDVTILEKKIGTLLVLACDGIWDTIDNQQLINYIFNKKSHKFTNLITFDGGKICTIDKYCQLIKESSLCGKTNSHSIENICENLINIAFDLGSKDNLTIAIYNC